MEKKVVFSATNNVSQTARQIYSEADASAKKQTASLKEQNSLIALQIKLLEKKKTLETSTEATKVKGMFTAAGEMGVGAERSAAFAKARRAESSLTQKSAEGVEIITILKNLHAEAKKSTSNAEKTEKTSQRKTISSEEQYQSMKSLARQEVKEGDKSKLRARIAAAEKEDFAGMDPRTAEKLMYQKSILADKDGSKSGVFGQVFAGTLLADIVSKAISSVSRITGAESGDQALSTLLGSLSVAGASFERTRQEQYSVQTRRLGLRGVAGRNVGEGDTGFNQSIGFSTQEGLDITKGLVGAAGTASNAGRNANQAMLLNRGAGLPIELITQIVKDLRLTSSSADIMKIAADVIKANPELRKDQVKFAEILQQTSQLTNEIASKAEGASIGYNTGIVGALRSVGGNLANQNSGALMSQINASLSNPGNDFQKSLNFGALNKINPGMSYWRLREEQEKGLGAKGLMSERLRQMVAMGGTGENLTGQISTSFFGGQNVGTSRRIAEMFKRNPNAFDNFTGTTAAEVEAFSTGKKKTAIENTSPRDRELATINNAFLKSEFDGLAAVGVATKDAITKLGDRLIEALNAPKTPEEKAKILHDVSQEHKNDVVFW